MSAAQELQYRALKRQIETLRWERPISGYVITELNDVQWESNGLMDVRNRPRAFAGRLANLQRPWLIMAQTARTAVRAGERFEVSMRLAGAAEPPEGARLKWRFADQSGETALGTDPTTVALTACAAEAIAIVPLELEARDGGGRLLSRNAMELCVVPPLGGAAPSLFPIDGAAWSALAAIGWPNRAATAEDAEIVLATRLTTPVRAALLAGRKVVLIANSADALIDPQRNLPLNDRHNFPSMLLRERAGAPWDGQWMGAFSWRRTDGPWSGLPGGPMLDEHWTGLTPNHVLTGFPSTAFRRIGRFRRGGRVAASCRRVCEAQLPRQGLAHRVDLRPHVSAGARKSARAASHEGAGGELSGGAVRVIAAFDFAPPPDRPCRRERAALTILGKAFLNRSGRAGFFNQAKQFSRLQGGTS